MQIVELLDRYGVSVGMLSVLLSFLWATIRWLAPRLDKLLNRHIAFMDQMQEQGASHLIFQAKVSETLAKHQATLEEHREQLTRIENRIDEGLKHARP